MTINRPNKSIELSGNPISPLPPPPLPPLCTHVSRYPLNLTYPIRLFCVHGGISPNLDTLGDIKMINRFVEPVDGSLLADLLWADPDDDEAVVQTRTGDRSPDDCVSTEVCVPVWRGGQGGGGGADERHCGERDNVTRCMW